MTEDSPRSPRTSPGRFNSRFYGLRGLNRAIDGIIDGIAAESAGVERTIVDFGCGDMPYRERFLTIADRYIGVDLASNAQADVALDADGRVSALDDAVGDIVVSTQVLEHVDDPNAYLREARRLAAPDGRLILSTHGMYRHHPHPNDYWRWTGQGLRELLRREGWEVTECIGILGFPAASFQLLQDALVQRLPKITWLRRLAAGVLQQGVGLLSAFDRRTVPVENAALYLVMAQRAPDLAPSNTEQ